jgi:DNA polymerase I-like protein with 3'-5' exonuclease and polymerase domains
LHPDPPEHARVACVALAHVDDSGKVWSIGLPFDQGQRDKIAFAQGSLDVFGFGTDDPNLPREDWEYLLDWLVDRPIVMHNAKYDLAMMRVGTRHWPGRDYIDQKFWDTMQVQVILDPKEDKGLDSTMQRLGLGGKQGLDALKGWLKSEGHAPNRYDLPPWEIVRPYVTTDAEDTARLYRHQVARLRPVDGILATEELQRAARAFDLTRALYGMEKRGMPYDADESVKAGDILLSQAARIEATMPFLCQPKQSHAYFFGKLGLEPLSRSEKTGKARMDEVQVRKWVADDVPFAAEFAEVTKKRRAVSMWYHGYVEKIGHDGRLRTMFRQGHVKSGRMSVERVQLQAIPKADKNIEGVPGVRQFIYSPDPAKGLWNLDLAQAELRVASKYSQCELMLSMLAQGVDFHSETTIDVIKATPDQPDWKEQRDIGKRVNFSAIFQIGPAHLQEIVDKMTGKLLPMGRCEQIIRDWRRKYPEFQREYYSSMRRAEAIGRVTLLPGTRYEVESYFGPRDYANTAWNRRVQGSLAEAFGIWLGEIEKRWPGQMILTVHDSVVLECLLDEGDQIAKEIADFGAPFMSELFDIEMGVDIDRWDKTRWNPQATVAV